MRKGGKKRGRGKEGDKWGGRGGGGRGEGEERDGEEVCFLRVGRGKAKSPASSRGSPPSVPGRLTPRGMGDLKIYLCRRPAPSRALGTRPNVPSACAACRVPAGAAGAPPAPPRPCLRCAARVGGISGSPQKGRPLTCERRGAAESAAAMRCRRSEPPSAPRLCPPLAFWPPSPPEGSSRSPPARLVRPLGSQVPLQ